MSEKFNLKWNDFHSNVSKSFGLFRNESYLHDVTLVSEDFKHIPAHKLVLSTSSEYFRNIFQQTRQTQPLICLDGVNSVDVQNVLDYVYNGEIRIYQEDLDRFLNVAQKLKLEGLIGGEEDPKQEPPAQTETVYEPESEIRRGRPVKIKTQQNQSSNDVVALNDLNQSTFDKNIDVNDGDETMTCKVCGKVATGPNRRKLIRQHMQVHSAQTFDCQQCNKTFRSKNSLNVHKYMNHRF